jgi:hypothetical protein
VSGPTPEQVAARTRLLAVADALGDNQGARVGVVVVRRRIDALAAEAVLARRPDLVGHLRPARVPGVPGVGPETAAESLLWDACARYELTAGLIEVCVVEERILRVPVAALLGDAGQN